MKTKLAGITTRTVTQDGAEFHQLMHHFDKDALLHCYHSLDGKAASGSDGITKESYGAHLETNLDALLCKLKAMSYRPTPAREVRIPKEGQRKVTRPLGIGNFEDKIVQKGMQEVLTAIYEPRFLDCSYGFRPGRGCHDAIKALRNHLFTYPVERVLDLDLANYFGSIDHGYLMEMLSETIKDNRFLRYVTRLLKAGVLRNGELQVTDEGVPQGSICSPILANIFAHYVLDGWMENTVRTHCRGHVELFRYADDAVICCELASDALRIRKAIGHRLHKFKLSLNEDKTREIIFNKRNRDHSGAFDFLGFTFYLGLSKRGKVIPKVKSSGKKLRVKLKRVNIWCNKHRHELRLLALWKTFCLKLRGHIQYYGVSFNSYSVNRFIQASTRIFFKWMNRRSQRRSLNREQLLQFLESFPAPTVRVYHRLF
jgi:RNA-directed DNA polymerase